MWLINKVQDIVNKYNKQMIVGLILQCDKNETNYHSSIVANKPDNAIKAVKQNGKNYNVPSK